jgi:lipopolysaccharide assembly outer membrane protein LptD (OstA)
MTYNRSYNIVENVLKTKHNYVQTLGMSAQLRFTKALMVNVNTGFDIVNKKLTTTQLNATYDLHCFLISISWIPQGQWQSWSFRINAKASALADLLQFKKNASYWDK